MPNCNDLAFANLASEKLEFFPKFASNNLNPPHLSKMANIIQNTIEWTPISDKNKMLIISIQPRIGKTELCSKHLPAWFMAKYPEKHCICSSYSAELTESNSGVAKQIFEENCWIFNREDKEIKPSKIMFNKAEWNTNHGGKCKASGIGGSVTGFGADLFIIDDYVKDQMEAESKTIRDHVWGWWESVAATRLHPNSTVLLIATRWHDDDLIGRILKKKRTEGKDFPFELVEISIPALCVDPKNDLLGRKKDEVIWPSRFSEKRIKYTKSIVGSYYWNAQFMCNPVSRGGILFKRDDFRYFDYDEQTKAYFCYREDKDPIKIMRRALRIYLFCDPAIEEKKKDDPTGMVVIAYAPKEKFFLVLYARSERINARNILKELDLTAKRFGAMKIYVENEKLGKVIRQQSYGSTETPIAEVSHKGLDKYARATPMATHTENERCFFDKYGSWVSEFEEQLVKFPNAEHDEYVDCFAYASTLESRISVAEALRGRRS